MAPLDLVFDRRPGHVGVPAVEVLRQRTRPRLHLTSMARPGRCLPAAAQKTPERTRPPSPTRPNDGRDGLRQVAVSGHRPGAVQPATAPARTDHPDTTATAGCTRRPEGVSDRRIREVKDPRHGRRPRPKAVREHEGYTRA